MRTALIFRGLAALVIACAMTALSLLAVVGMSREPVDPIAVSHAQPIEIMPVPAAFDEHPSPPIEALAMAPMPAEPSTPPAMSPNVAPSVVASSARIDFGPPGDKALTSLDSALLSAEVTLAVAEQSEPETIAARPISRPHPRYPKGAQQAGIEGHVVVRLRVDDKGQVVDAIVVESVPARVFDDAAVETAMTYRFSPARRGGKAVATTVQQRLVFRLKR